MPQEYMSAVGTGGMVYASLGTVCSVDASEYLSIAAALSGLDVPVIWKLGPWDLPPGLAIDDLNIGPNVKV